MAISELDRKRIEVLLSKHCDRIPMHVRDQIRHVYTVGPTSVELFEERPSFRDPAEWSRHPVAKFRYVAKLKLRTLYCVHRDLKWHSYGLLPQAGSIEILLREVERDPTGIFWG